MRAELRRTGCLRRICWLCLLCPLPLLAQPKDSSLCEYQTVPLVSPDSGDVRLSRQKIGEHECDEIGAAVGELSPAWRQRLPMRVRWVQRTDTAELCRQTQSDLGMRIDSELGSQGCVFLRKPEACTIVSTSALSHAQLANAVRDCAP